MPRSATPVVLAPPQRAALTGLVRADSTPQALAWRARIVLACADGLDDSAAARREQTSRVTVGLWRKRFLGQGIAGLHDQPRPGRPPVLPPGKINTVLTAVVQPPKGRTRWSIRSMARPRAFPRRASRNSGRTMTSSPISPAPSSFRATPTLSRSSGM